jgi:formylglycine-generating enzyme required for sulfatase activity
MRVMKKWVLVAVGTAMLVSAGRAEEFAIRSYDGTGKLVPGPVLGATNFEVRTSAAVTGGWSVAGSVAPTAGNALTTTVSVAGAAGTYKIVAFTNAAPPSAGDYLVIDLSAGPSVSSYPVTYLTTVPPGGWTDEYKTTKLVMRRIPKGTFTMGSPADELGREPWAPGNEAQRQVTLTKDYYIGVFEVTQKQWERVMGNWPSFFNNTTCRESRPVEKVSYYDIRENPANNAISPNWPQSAQVHANSFMGKLRAKTGLTALDLPTEAQWEYACRAGTTTALNSGKNLTSITSCPNLSEVGRYWYNGGLGYTKGGNTSVGSAKVGSYLPNAWGLYDMHGNVWEWCLDWYETYHAPTTDPVGAASGSYRVFRGGGWYYIAGYCRAANCYYYRYPLSRYCILGFRLSSTVRAPDLAGSHPVVPVSREGGNGTGRRGHVSTRHNMDLRLLGECD